LALRGTSPIPVARVVPASSARRTRRRPARGQTFSEVFSSIRLRDYAKIYAGSTFWWTIGGEGIARVAMPGKEMPRPVPVCGNVDQRVHG
jgi:hypothetical protein